MNFRFPFNKGALCAGMFLLGLALTKLMAQTVDDFGKAPQLSYDSATGVYTISWWGQSGNTFFLQHSLDLQSWTTLDVIEPGQDQVIGYGLTTTAPNNFWRVGWADIVVADPDLADFDSDGLSNRTEINLGTDPLKADTDSDGIPDGWEVAHGLDPTITNVAAADADGDGLTDLQEYQSGTNPQNTDTDGDGVADLQEQTLGTNPLNMDSDSDGLTDGQEVALGTNPNASTIIGGTPNATWLSRTYITWSNPPPEMPSGVWSEWGASPPQAALNPNTPAGVQTLSAEYYLLVPPGSNGTLHWIETFTPYDAEYNPLPTQFTARSWDIAGTQSSLFTLNAPSSAGTIGVAFNKIEFVKDGANDHTIDDTDPVISYARIGHWGADRSDGGVDGYQEGEFGTPRNTTADNFVDKDPERFYVRVVDPSANLNPNAKDTMVVKISTLRATGNADDALSEITLEETDINTGVFVSEAQLLVSSDIPTESDAGYSVVSKYVSSPAENARDDRTHRATIDGLVRVEYQANSQTYSTNMAVCNRSPDERRTLNVVVNNFNEPWQDTNANGKYDVGEPFIDISNGRGQEIINGVDRASRFDTTGTRGPIWTEEQVNAQMAGLHSILAVAGIRIVETARYWREPAGKLFAQDGNGVVAATTGRFDMADDDVTEAKVSRDNAIIQANFRSASQFNGDDSDDVVDIYFLPPFTAHDSAYGFQIRPGYVASFDPPLATNLINSVLISYDAAIDNIPTTLAHEILHQLTNQGHSPNALPHHIIFPTGSGAGSNDGSSVLWWRRIQQSTATDARAVRPSSSMTATGNRLLRVP